jgi:hypothetical protein
MPLTTADRNPKLGVLNLVGKDAAHPPPSCRSLAARNIRQWGTLQSNRTKNTEAKMKEFTPNGAAIKRIRGQLERLSTQKEFARNRRKRKDASAN